MTTYGVVENPETVDYSTKCCCQTTDDQYYQVPKEFFSQNPQLTRRKLILSEPFAVPLDAAQFENLLVLLEKAVILRSAVDGEKHGDDSAKQQWMADLNKRQQKFVSSCLGITSWDGKDAPFYEQTLPKLDDIVWVKITQVTETSAVVQLLEYGKREGIIPYTEVTRRRVRSMGKLIKVGRCEAAQVIRIDKDKGYIDLSKKEVKPNEAKECEMRFRKGNDVRSIVCHVASECNISPYDAMEEIAYPLYSRQPGKHAWSWLHELNQTQNVADILGPLNLDENVVNCLLLTLKNAMRTKVVNLHAEVEMTCYEFDGVDAIREVLQIGKSYQGKSDAQLDIPLSVIIIGPPKYGLRARTDMADEGQQLMSEAIEKMSVEIAKRNGRLKVITPPSILGDDDKPERHEDPEDDDDAE